MSREKTVYCGCYLKAHGISGNRVMEICQEIFGSEDRFSTAPEETVGGYTLILLNSKNEGGLYIGENGEFSIPPVDFSGDWKSLMTTLSLLAVDYMPEYGIVAFYD